ncbi:prepilin-type N-terminal cleavage/methylation domain-containing protein [Amycolatopsis tolypomycina]|uniref:Prepilin-type N-terminal cleavage/methylation domain-containing protein n=1 Tax=Amycolatopsis tolypomycina TaxID=208445 RepID=A0A1H4WC32_9PSEU|nr:prepilin-type N-terminal cleavage/methylation domain-containing protein [Amycolatopsis tolypomycina]SEC90191.1 prepilin-type N-terminal cleavage/methylation domain-containing protein [Amycolatopsis tolypomycina]
MLSRRSDAGFTLVELLIVVVILGVVAAPIANAVIVSIQNTDATAARLAVSHDAQQSAAFFAQDVAAVGLRDYSGAVANGKVPYSPSIQLGATYDSGAQVCGTAATPVSVVRLLSDDWDTGTPVATRRTAVVAYYLAGTELHRLRCLDSATVSDAVVAHHVDPATPAVTCSSACADAAVPLWVKFTFTAVAEHADPYPITLFGQRRQT